MLAAHAALELIEEAVADLVAPPERTGG